MSFLYFRRPAVAESRCSSELLVVAFQKLCCCFQCEGLLVCFWSGGFFWMLLYQWNLTWMLLSTWLSSSDLDDVVLKKACGCCGLEVLILLLFLLFRLLVLTWLVLFFRKRAVTVVGWIWKDVVLVVSLGCSDLTVVVFQMTCVAVVGWIWSGCCSCCFVGWFYFAVVVFQTTYCCCCWLDLI